MTYELARMHAPAARLYRGSITAPERWATWAPRPGDVLVCTPPKCGTTWTQTMLAMLIAGEPALPDKLAVVSPWVDADFDPAEEVASALIAKEGRRVVKTHTPADGFPVWEDVTVVCVYRHPLDLFFSLRKHVANMVQTDETHPMRAPVADALQHFLTNPVDIDDLDRDSLPTVACHYEKSILSGRLQRIERLHYADMIADHRGTVARLARIVGREGETALIDQVVAATEFAAMKSAPEKFAPEGGKGFWHADAAFFDSASSRKWEGQLDEAQLAAFETRLAELIPDTAARDWLKFGNRGTGAT